MLKLLKKPKVAVNFYVVWKDAPDQAPVRTFERFAGKPDELKALEPGKFWTPMGHRWTRWTRKQFGSDKLHLFTITDRELSKREVKDLAKQAYEWVKAELEAAVTRAYGSPQS